jgi:hypothetical protein
MIKKNNKKYKEKNCNVFMENKKSELKNKKKIKKNK